MNRSLNWFAIGTVASVLLGCASRSTNSNPAIPEASYEHLLAKQLAMNRQTWTVLRSNGVTERSDLRLDFSYDAPSREAAQALVELLKKETDYEVKIESEGSVLEKRWRVEGQTQETTISPSILEEWVIWMVITGKKKACRFDGWGTEVP